MTDDANSDDARSSGKFQRRWDRSDQRQLNEDRRRLLLRPQPGAPDGGQPKDQQTPGEQKPSDGEVDGSGG